MLSACSPAQRDSDQIEIVVPTEIATLDPRFSIRSLDIKTTRLLHSGLFGLDPDTLAPVPLLAERFSFSGTRQLDVWLRPGLKFHSGKAVWAQDVCATINAIGDPQLGSPHRAVVRAIDRCVAPSDLQVTIHLKYPRATLLSDLELPILNAEDVRKPPDPTGQLDGAGPFQLATLGRGEVTLKPAGVADDSPKRTVVVRTVRDENARALRLMAGRSDIAPNSISAPLLPALAAESNLTVNARSGANVTYMLLQNDRPPFDDPRARRALAMAIDRPRLIKYLLAGRAQLANWIFPSSHWAGAPQLPVIAYDRDRARKVLSTLPAITLTTSTDRARLTMARAIAQMLRDAGLTVRIVSLDLGVMLKRLDSGDFHAATLQMPELTEPNILKWFFHPSAVPGEGGEGRNRARYRSTRAGKLLDRGAADSNRSVRQRAYRELATVMMADLPVVPLWHEDQVAVVSNRAKSFRLSAEGRWVALSAGFAR